MRARDRPRWTRTYRGVDLRPLFDVLLARIPAPTYEPDHGLQALVTNLDASPYVGRLALCRVVQGSIRPGRPWPGAGAMAASNSRRSRSST